jgi:hypothetical protein
MGRDEPLRETLHLRRDGVTIVVTTTICSIQSKSTLLCVEVLGHCASLDSLI